MDNTVAIWAFTSGIAVAVVFVFWKKFSQESAGHGSPTKNHKIKKGSAAKPVQLTKEGQIENIRLRYENEYKTRIEKLLQVFNKDDEKLKYERNFCNEMLLKLLIELDGVDLIDLPTEERMVLKQQRKDIIKLIQSELKVLDSLK